LNSHAATGASGTPDKVIEQSNSTANTALLLSRLMRQVLGVAPHRRSIEFQPVKPVIPSILPED
jgi:hypothetical protein